MIKISMSLLLVLTQVFAVNIGMFRIKNQENSAYIKILLKHEMLSYHRAKQRTGHNDNADYITNVRVHLNEELIYDIETSPFLGKNPTFKFKTKKVTNNDTIKITFVDNKSNITTTYTKVEKDQKKVYKLETKFNLHKEKINQNMRSSIWRKKTIESAIKELYGSNLIYEQNKQIEPELTVNGPKLTISSNKDLESIAIFSDTNGYSTIGIIHVKKTTEEINYLLPTVSLKSGKIVVIAKDINGNFYKAILPVILGCIYGGDEGHSSMHVKF